MKTRSARWSLLVLPILILGLACAGEQPPAADTQATAPAPATETRAVAAVQAQAGPCANVAPSEFIILVDVDPTTAAISSVTPAHAQVCAQHKVIWASTEKNVKIKIFWKRVTRPAGGALPGALPCDAENARCGGAPIAAPPGHVIEYGVRAFPPSGGQPQVFDPVLEVLP